MEQDMKKEISPSLSRALVLLVTAALVAATGCSQVCEIPVNEIDPDRIGKAQVITTNGYVYEFEDVFVRADSLVGTYQLTEERLYKDGSIAYVDVDYETVLSLTLVSHLEIEKTDIGNTILLGAGATVLGFWISGLDEILPGRSNGGTYVKDTGGGL
jgi:hypothetical protein